MLGMGVEPDLADQENRARTAPDHTVQDDRARTAPDLADHADRENRARIEPDLQDQMSKISLRGSMTIRIANDLDMP